MNPFLEQLIDLTLSDFDAAVALLDSHSQEITPELAAEAHAAFSEAAQAQDLGHAEAAAIVASRLYLKLGNRYEGLNHNYLFQEVRYLAGSTEEEYQGVRQEMPKLISLAEEISAPDLAFAMATLAANCAYFTADLQQAPAVKENWLRQALGDLVLASGYGPHAAAGDLEQFVSLLAGFMEVFTPLVPAPDADLERQLRQLARAVEQFVPVDFQFRLVGDLAKSILGARWLAVLSRRFGDSEIARRRLEFAARNNP